MDRDPDGALVEAERLIAEHPGAWRYAALRADARRDLGDVDGAVADYLTLLELHRGGRHEAVLQQHLGKAYWARGDADAAAAAFEKALDLRTLEGADAELIESSRRALHRARRAPP